MSGTDPQKKRAARIPAALALGAAVLLSSASVHAAGPNSFELCFRTNEAPYELQVEQRGAEKQPARTRRKQQAAHEEGPAAPVTTVAGQESPEAAQKMVAPATRPYSGNPAIDSFAPFLPNAKELIEEERAGNPAWDSMVPVLPRKSLPGLLEREQAGDAAVDSIVPMANVPPAEAARLRRARIGNTRIDSFAPMLTATRAQQLLEDERSGRPELDSIAPAIADAARLLEKERSSDPVFAVMAADAAAQRLDDGVLRSCAPTTLACVSSQDDTPASFVEPWEYDVASVSPAEARERVLAAILAEGGRVDEVAEANYVHASFAPDDELELYFTPGDATVQLRADGNTHPNLDFGRNRRRAERIRRRAGLDKLVVLRGRAGVVPLLETPFDSFAPSLPDADAVIDAARRGGGKLAEPLTR